MSDIRIRSFASDTAGSSIEKFSVAAGLIALTAIAATHVLATLSRYGHVPILASLQSAATTPNNGPTASRIIRPENDEVDYSVTGAIYRTVLDPCSGKSK
jgi:hypothetical protein